MHLRNRCKGRSPDYQLIFLYIPAAWSAASGNWAPSKWHKGTSFEGHGSWTSSKLFKGDSFVVPGSWMTSKWPKGAFFTPCEREREKKSHLAC
jgi:hypothetical protein